jgi:hypothetical protein
MPEVQKPILEHPAPKACEKENLKTATPETVRIPLVLELQTKDLEQPDRVKNVTISLPSGITAKFIRSGSWASR